jgi:hypothetical protein
MKQQPVKRDTDILRYWASKEYEYPTVARMARDHLRIPAMSAASKCVLVWVVILLLKRGIG